MRGEAADAGALANSPDHPHERLGTRRLLRILLPPNPLMLRHPLLNFYGEDMIVQLWLQRAEQRTKLADHVGIERQPLPVPVLPIRA